MKIDATDMFVAADVLEELGHWPLGAAGQPILGDRCLDILPPGEPLESSDGYGFDCDAAHFTPDVEGDGRGDGCQAHDVRWLLGGEHWAIEGGDGMGHDQHREVGPITQFREVVMPFMYGNDDFRGLDIA